MTSEHSSGALPTEPAALAVAGAGVGFVAVGGAQGREFRPGQGYDGQSALGG